MSTMNRRRFALLGAGGLATAALTACGNDVGDETALNPTRIPDVPGAPQPTLADMATPGGSAPEGEAGGSEGGEAGGGAISLTALDTLKWDPPELSGAPGDVITVTNGGVLAHDFTIDDFGGVLVDLPSGGATEEWTIPSDAEVGASFEYYCAIPGHKESGMVGTLTIVEAGAASAGSEEPAASPVAEGSAAPAEQAPAETGGGPIVLEALDPYAWSTNEISAAPGQVIQVTNTGVLVHDFSIDEFGGVLVDLPSSGASGEWEVPPDAAVGTTYTYYCAEPGHRESGMEGTLTIS